VSLVTTGASALIPIGVAYAVAKHRVFDIAVVVRRGVQYLLARRSLQFLMALPATVVVLTVVTHRDSTIGELLSESAAYLWVIGGTAFPLRFRQPLLRSLDRRFFREQYDREQVLVDLLDDLARLTEADDVARLVHARVDQALHPTSVRLWFEGDPAPPAESLLAAIEQERVGPDKPLTSGPHLPDGISVVVPLPSSDERLAGALTLGEKRSEEPYSANDLALLGPYWGAPVDYLLVVHTKDSARGAIQRR
jgi:hypothetical protein